MSITVKKTRERFKKLREEKKQRDEAASNKAKTTAKTATTTKKKSGLSDFEKAFATARRNFIGKKIDPKTGKPAKATFMFKGKRYNVQTKEDRAKVVSKIPSPVKRGSGTSKTTKAATSTTKPTTTKKAAASTTKPTTTTKAATSTTKPRTGRIRGTGVKKIGLEESRLLGLTGEKLRTGVEDQKREMGIAKRAQFDARAKQVEQAKRDRAKSFLDPLMAITAGGTRALTLGPKNLKTMVLDRLGSTKRLSGPPKTLPRPRGMAKGGSFFKGNF